MRLTGKSMQIGAPRKAAGFSLVEVMCAILILGVALAGLTEAISTALSSNKESELQSTAAMIAAGTAIALPCVWRLGRLVESQLFGVTPTDPVTIAATTSLLAMVALGAALVPAYGASTVNPTDALRAE